MAAARTPVDIGAVLGGRYRLVARIGTGTSARVFLAVDPLLQRRVAVKVLHEGLAGDERFLDRFRREARVVAALQHDHVLAVLDSGEDASDEVVLPYLVTEYLDGGSLADLLASGHRLTPSQAAAVGRQAAEALAYAHARGVVHRDVKPANLLFDRSGRLRLADFGIARALAEASWTEPSGTGVGTTRYASPEQVMGRPLDGRSDVYSLALVMMEAVTGVVPLLADTAAGTMGLRTQRDVDVSVDFGDLREPLTVALERDTDRRADAADFAAALRVAGDDMPPPGALPLGDAPAESTSELRIHDGTAGLAVIGPLAGDIAAPDGDDAGVTGDLAGDDRAGDDRVGDDRVGDDRVGGVGTDAASAAAVPWAGAGTDTDTGTETETGTEPGTGSPDAVDAEPQDDPLAAEYAALAAARPSSHGPVEAYTAPRGPAAGVQEAEPATDDAPRRRWPRRLALVLLVVVLAAGSLGAWYLLRTPTHEVPDWVGARIDDATTRAEALGWDVTVPESERRDGTAAGEVLAQEPAPGTVLEEGESVAFTVSLGPTLTALPDVSGRPEAEAVAAIEQAGLVLGERTAAFDEEVPAGTVLVSGPAAGSEPPDDRGRVPRGTAVDIVVSDGPAPRVVPGGLVGVPVQEAVDKLEAVQLGASVEEQYSDSVAAGVTISAAAAEGTEVPRGAIVGLVVSLGPQPVAVPDVAGSDVASAEATLSAAGFRVSGVEGSPSGTVLATDPPAGELHQKGTSVRVFTRQ